MPWEEEKEGKETWIKDLSEGRRSQQFDEFGKGNPNRKGKRARKGDFRGTGLLDFSTCLAWPLFPAPCQFSGAVPSFPPQQPRLPARLPPFFTPKVSSIRCNITKVNPCIPGLRTFANKEWELMKQIFSSCNAHMPRLRILHTI